MTDDRPDDNDLTVLGIDNVVFTVDDLAAAVRFYTERLGLALVLHRDAAGVAVLALGPERPGLLLRRRRPDEPAGGGRVWLEVRDARAAARALAATGPTGLGTPFAVATGWTVEISDPGGNVVGLTDYQTMPDRGRP